MSETTAFLAHPASVSARSTAPLFQLLYVSSAVSPFSTAELVTLLEKSRKRNDQTGISGMLLYYEANFMQLLEGLEEQIRLTHARIIRDRRHDGCLTLIHYNSLLNPGAAEHAFPCDGNRALKRLKMSRDKLR